MLNTLFVTTPNAYLTLQNETLCVLQDDVVKLRVPLLNLEGVRGLKPHRYTRGSGYYGGDE